MCIMYTNYAIDTLLGSPPWKTFLQAIWFFPFVPMLVKAARSHSLLTCGGLPFESLVQMDRPGMGKVLQISSVAAAAS